VRCAAIHLTADSLREGERYRAGDGAEDEDAVTAVSIAAVVRLHADSQSKAIGSE
jgi:hypothetical protein